MSYLRHQLACQDGSQGPSPCNAALTPPTARVGPSPSSTAVHVHSIQRSQTSAGLLILSRQVEFLLLYQACHSGFGTRHSDLEPVMLASRWQRRFEADVREYCRLSFYSFIKENVVTRDISVRCKIQQSAEERGSRRESAAGGLGWPPFMRYSQKTMASYSLGRVITNSSCKILFTASMLLPRTLPEPVGPQKNNGFPELTTMIRTRCTQRQGQSTQWLTWE